MAINVSTTVEAERDENVGRQKSTTCCTLEFEAICPALTPLGTTVLTYTSEPHYLT